MPLIRDEQEERLARIEQIVEDLQRASARFGEFRQSLIIDARLAREQAETARSLLHKSVRQSETARRRNEADRKR